MKEELIHLCHANNILIETNEKKVDYGWVNKPKGLLKFLYERGWIDITKVKTPRSSRYSLNGKKNDPDVITGLIKEEKKNMH